MTDSAYDRAVAALDARGPGRMVPDLDRITRLAELLGDPQRSYPSVHVTGTNGKGSTVRMLGALCASAGLRAGTYTSPHLQSVRERFQVAGRWIGPGRFAEVHAELAPLIGMVDQEVDGHVTYFETLTAMAYWWFADEPVDVGVFEVGMGGTWDATNLVRGDVAVIGPVDLDHRELGGTPAEVAREKAGIIKPAATVVSAEQVPEVAEVIAQAADDAGATLWREGHDFGVVERRPAVGGQTVALRVGDRVVGDVTLPVFGAHQAGNAARALAAFAALTRDSFAGMDDDVVRDGFAGVTVPGRLEVVNREPTIVLDGAHNPHAARALAAALGEAFGFRNTILVVACLEDKDIEGILRPFRGVADHVVVTRVRTPRAASSRRMADVAHAVWEGSPVLVEQAADLDEALELATGVAGAGDGVVVTGSLYLAGAARDRYVPVGPADEAVADDPDGSDDEDDAAFQEALQRMLDAVDRERGAE